jgi:hypothetical protein
MLSARLNTFQTLEQSANRLLPTATKSNGKQPAATNLPAQTRTLSQHHNVFIFNKSLSEAT